ncbi:MAG: tRNA pseudouridine(38-40) synthase TruA [Myxococcales bacterium]|nr:tRNA pseudouridine(38-40) synthase TruA [Myxococcales bacterium]
MVDAPPAIVGGAGAREPLLEGATRTLLLTVQYDGTDFHGWQIQPGQRTIQGTLAERLEALVHHPVMPFASSRTDAGVHARALPVAFDTMRAISEHSFLRALTSTLPEDIGVLSVEERGLGFRPRYASVAKTYRYRYLLGRSRRPLVDRYAYFVGYPRVDLDAMREATAELRGEHDFSAFRSAQCESPSRRRFLHALTLSEPDADNVATLEVTGNAFLRNMMRIIAGTLLDVGLGRRTPGSLAALIAGKDRREAGATLPACGLTLTAVHFDGYPRLGKPDPAGAPDDDEEGD